MYFSHTGIQNRSDADVHSFTDFENESKIRQNSYKPESQNKGSSGKSSSVPARPPPSQANNSFKNKKLRQENDQDPSLTKGVHSTGIRGDRFQDAMQALSAKRKSTRFAI